MSLTKPASARTKSEMTLDEKIREIFLAILKNLTKHHKDIGLDVKPGLGAITMTIIVHREDHGKIIGRAGIHHAALLAIFKTICARHGITSIMSIGNPQVGEKPLMPLECKPNPSFNTTELQELLKETLKQCFKGEIKSDFVNDKKSCTMRGEIQPTEDRDFEILYAISHAFVRLWEAMAKAHGYNFAITVTPPGAVDVKSIKV